MPRYLIDKQGRPWDPYDDRLLAVLGDPQPDYDILAYAVRNMGAVDLEIRESRVDIRFRRLTIGRPALDALNGMLIGLPVRQIVVRCEAEQWNEQSFTTPEAALAWIEANGTVLPADGTRNMVTTPRSMAALSDRRLSRIEEGEDRLALIFKKWRLSQGMFNSDAASFLVRFGLLDRTVVVAEAHSDNELVFEHSGSAFALYESHDKTWNFRAQGVKVADQPDRKFGQWIDSTYRGVLDAQQPRFDAVDAVIQARGAEPYRFCYDRLLLPWRNPQGARVLTGTSYNRHVGRVDSGD